MDTIYTKNKKRYSVGFLPNNIFQDYDTKADAIRAAKGAGNGHIAVVYDHGPNGEYYGESQSVYQFYYQGKQLVFKED